MLGVRDCNAAEVARKSGTVTYSLGSGMVTAERRMAYLTTI